MSIYPQIPIISNETHPTNSPILNKTPKSDQNLALNTQPKKSKNRQKSHFPSLSFIPPFQTVHNQPIQSPSTPTNIHTNSKIALRTLNERLLLPINKNDHLFRNAHQLSLIQKQKFNENQHKYSSSDETDYEYHIPAYISHTLRKYKQEDKKTTNFHPQKMPVLKSTFNHLEFIAQMKHTKEWNKILTRNEENDRLSKMYSNIGHPQNTNSFVPPSTHTYTCNTK